MFSRNTGRAKLKKIKADPDRAVRRRASIQQEKTRKTRFARMVAVITWKWLPLNVLMFFLMRQRRTEKVHPSRGAARREKSRKSSQGLGRGKAGVSQVAIFFFRKVMRFRPRNKSVKIVHFDQQTTTVFHSIFGHGRKLVRSSSMHPQARSPPHAAEREGAAPPPGQV